MLSNTLKPRPIAFTGHTLRRWRLLQGMIVLLGCTVIPLAADSAEPKPVRFDTFNGYFVSNKFEPDAAESYTVLTDQQAFEKVFGVAFVMGDKAHRLPENVFVDHAVVGVVKRGMATWSFQVKQITESNGELEIRYSTKEEKQPSATFASPLIVSVPKKPYKAVRFLENGKVIKTLKLPDDNQ